MRCHCSDTTKELTQLRESTVRTVEMARLLVAIWWTEITSSCSNYLVAKYIKAPPQKNWVTKILSRQQNFTMYLPRINWYRYKLPKVLGLYLKVKWPIVCIVCTVEQVPKAETKPNHTHTCHTIPQVLISCVSVAILLEVLYNTTFKCISTDIIP